MEKDLKVDKKKAKKAEKGPTIKPKTDSAKFYELGFILVPSLSVEKVQDEVKKLTELFSKAKGELISKEDPTLIDLAYPMLKVIHAHREKCFQGYFGWMKFEIETEAITEIKKSLDLSESVLRYLLIKTVRENTLLKGSMNLAHSDERKKKIVDEDGEEVIKTDIPAEINQEELDKSIDELVIA